MQVDWSAFLRYLTQAGWSRAPSPPGAGTGRVRWVAWERARDNRDSEKRPGQASRADRPTGTTCWTIGTAEAWTGTGSAMVRRDREFVSRMRSVSRDAPWATVATPGPPSRRAGHRSGSFGLRNGRVEASYEPKRTLWASATKSSGSIGPLLLTCSDNWSPS